MSIPEMKRFVADCHGNPDLAAQVAEAGTDLGAVVGVANRHGYQFTVDDAAAALAQTKLNESQLGQMAGGDGVVAVTANVVTTSIFGPSPTSVAPGLLVSQVVDVVQTQLATVQVVAVA